MCQIYFNKVGKNIVTMAKKCRRRNPSFLTTIQFLIQDGTFSSKVIYLLKQLFLTNQNA